MSVFHTTEKRILRPRRQRERNRLAEREAAREPQGEVEQGYACKQAHCGRARLVVIDAACRGNVAVFDKKVYDSNMSIEEKFVKRGLILIADTLEELGELMEVPADAFAVTMDEYNGAIADGAEDPFGRTESREPITDAPFYAIRVAPGIHHTMGGIRINTATEVLTADGTPIPGLFAAGEVTGGIHGGNRLGGNAICDINVFGHQAAMSAIAYLGIVGVDRETLVQMSAGGDFNQHATQHGATACTDCHRVDETPVYTCTECHDEAVAPQGWLTYDEAYDMANVSEEEPNA